MRARDLFVKILNDVRTEFHFALAGLVVMPEHFHLLMGEPNVVTPSTVMQVLKQRVSRELRKNTFPEIELPEKPNATHPLQTSQRAGHPEILNPKEPNSIPDLQDQEAGLRRFWQSRFYDFNVFTRKKKVEKLHYMHMNPVKRGLVEHPEDWHWSSYASYQRHSDALIQVDSVD